MMRRVVLTASQEVKESGARVHLCKIWYCPGCDDTGESVQTSLGIIEGTYEEAMNLLDDVRNANTAPCSWMP
jgi:hypothetical protein